ncbi:MAG: hypothetical protein AAF702_08525 [Chloroflexota bacterium]
MSFTPQKSSTLFVVVLIISIISVLTNHNLTMGLATASATATHEIVYTENGFTPSVLTIGIGDTVTWRNETSQPLNLRAGGGFTLFLPFMSSPSSRAMVQSTNQSTSQTTSQGTNPNAMSSNAQANAEPEFGSTLVAGATHSYQFAEVGQFAFHAGGQPNFKGTINVEAPNDVVPTPTPTPTSDRPKPLAPDDGGLDQSGLGYATSADRTLIRWFWTQPNQPTFRVLRQQGRTEVVLGDVAPVTDEATAIAVLNTTDPRWPTLWETLQAEHEVATIAELHTFLNENLFAAQQLANRYYPVALVLGWGLVDLDATLNPNAEVTYGVESVDGAIALGKVTLTPYQPTPLDPPARLSAVDLNPDSSTLVRPRNGQWAVAQQNRRFHQNIYLDWETPQISNDDDGELPPAWIVGYDIYRASAVNDEIFEQINGDESVQVMSDSTPRLATVDVPVEPDPENPAPVDPDYQLGDAYAADYEQIEFHFADDDVAAGSHAYRIAARDALGTIRSWPEDASFFSEDVKATSHDYMPPPAPELFMANVNTGQNEIQLTWAMTPTSDLAGFRIERTQKLHSEIAPGECASDADCWKVAATLTADENSWVDTDGTEETVRWYRIQAVDHAGNYSLYAGPIQSVIHDVDGPGKPGLNVDNCSDGMGYCLTGGGDEETERLRIACRMTLETPEVLLTIFEGSQLNEFNVLSVYTPPFDLENVICRTWAEDEHGNLSEPSDPIEIPLIEAPNVPNLLPPIITSIETSGSADTNWQANIKWDMVSSPVIADFEILRDNVSDAQPAEIIPVKGGDARDYTDGPLNSTNVYEYQVKAILSDGTELTSTPRLFRVVNGQERPLENFPWIGIMRQGEAINLLWQCAMVADFDGLAARHFAVFRSPNPDGGFQQITPIFVQEGCSQFFYADTSAQHDQYYYQVVEFSARTGEPVGSTDVRGVDNAAAPAIDYGDTVQVGSNTNLIHHTPGNSPLGLLPCTPINPSRNDFSQPLIFGGGIEMHNLSVDINNDNTINGFGDIHLFNSGELIVIPDLFFNGLTVADAQNHVCSGQIDVWLPATEFPSAPIFVESEAGMSYAVYRVVARSFFLPGSHGEIRLVLPDNLRSLDQNGVEADVVTLGGPALRLNNDLSWSFSADLADVATHTCESPVLAFNLELAPLTLVPLGELRVSSSRFEMSDSCLRYHERNNGAYARPAPFAFEAGDSNDGFLRTTFQEADGNDTSTRITASGLSGAFHSDQVVTWVGSYPYGFNIAASNIDLMIAESQIQSGNIGGGNLIMHYQQTVNETTQGEINVTFEGLTIEAGGALVGDVTQSGGADAITWRSFNILSGEWEFYAGPVTTNYAPISMVEIVMWAARPGDQVEVDLPAPALREPGLNRRLAAHQLTWACGRAAVFVTHSDMYVRHGGITQRFQAILEGGFETSIHGYDSVIHQFDVYFLDNRNVDSSIIGDVELPFPANMTLKLVDMWLDPTGCIDGGVVINGEETLDYWEAALAPRSAEFLTFGTEHSMPLNVGEFDGWDAMLRVFGDLSLPKLTTLSNGQQAIIDAGINFQPDGDTLDEVTLGQDQPIYGFTGFSFLMEELRLSRYNAGSGESPIWDANANALDAPTIQPAEQGFFEMSGPILVPYFSGLADSNGNDPVLFVYNGLDYVGFEEQLQAERIWFSRSYEYDGTTYGAEVKHVFDDLVYAHGLGQGSADGGIFVGFDSYELLPDNAVQPAGPFPSDWQVVHVDAGMVLQPDVVDIYGGLSGGVAAFRALAEQIVLNQDNPPSPNTLQVWGQKLNMNDAGDAVNEIDEYSALIPAVWPFYVNLTNPSHMDTTSVLNQYDMQEGIDLPTSEDFGGGASGMVRNTDIQFNRLRGNLVRTGSGAAFQFERFDLGMELIVHRAQDARPIFQADTVALTIDRWGEILIEGYDARSSIFRNENLWFNLTLRVDIPTRYLEGGLSLGTPEVGLLHEFEVWNVTLHDASGALGFDLSGGFPLAYVGLDLEGSTNFMPFSSNGFGGQVLFGTIRSDSAVLHNHFAEIMEHLNIVPDGPGSDQSVTESFQGGYIRMYGDGGLLSDLAAGKLNFDGGVRYGGWYWSNLNADGGNKAGAILGAYAYGRFLAVVTMRGDITFIYAYDAGDHSVSSDAWVAGGIGACEPETWTSWDSRWWHDRWCWTAGARLLLNWNVTQSNFDVDVQIDTE